MTGLKEKYHVLNLTLHQVKYANPTKMLPYIYLSFISKKTQVVLNYSNIQTIFIDQKIAIDYHTV